MLVATAQHLRLLRSPDLRPAPDSALRVATWNVHYILLNREEGRWGLSGWEARKGPLDAAFKALEVDIVAFQEMECFSGGNDDGVNLARAWLDCGLSPEVSGRAKKQCL